MARVAEEEKAKEVAERLRFIVGNPEFTASSSVCTFVSHCRVGIDWWPYRRRTILTEFTGIIRS